MSKVRTNVPLLNSADAVKRALLLGRSYTKLGARCEQCLGFDLLVSEFTRFKNSPILPNYLSAFCCSTKSGPLIKWLCGSKYSCYVLSYCIICCLLYEKWAGIHIFPLISRLYVYNYACHLTILTNIAEWTFWGQSTSVLLLITVYPEME